ncbi:MAG: PilZ domain-containing protein [Desulfovibrionaceae bacterium]
MMRNVQDSGCANVRLLLIAEQGPSRTAYEKSLQEMNVAYDALSSPGEMKNMLTETPYNGLLLDVPTMIRASGRDKMHVNEMLERFPVLRLIYDAQHGRIRGLHYGRSSDNAVDLKTFIRQSCAALPARSIRAAQRRNLHLNVWLLPESHAPLSAGERTVTSNVSEVGCFLITSRPWKNFERLWLVFREFTDKSPVQARIRWRKTWGEALEIPGLGIQFEQISPSQREDLLKLL